MLRADIINMVMARIDELIPEGTELLVQNDPLPVYSYIDSIIDECSDDVRKVAPLHYCAKISEIAVDTTNKCIIVPSGYIRFGWVKCADWGKPAFRLIEPNKEPDLYSIVTNSTITKGKANPFAAINRKIVEVDGESVEKGVIELYNTDEANATLCYVEKLITESADERLLPSITWLCAMKILLISGRKEAETANTQFTNAIKLLTA